MAELEDVAEFRIVGLYGLAASGKSIIPSWRTAFRLRVCCYLAIIQRSTPLEFLDIIKLRLQSALVDALL